MQHAGAKIRTDQDLDLLLQLLSRLPKYLRGLEPLQAAADAADAAADAAAADADAAAAAGRRERGDDRARIRSGGDD